MTAEELLATMAEPLAEDDGYCTIDPETRVIAIPPEYQLLGVESDEKAERIYFKCPKIVGDNIDLTKLALRVNFRNAGQVVDQYLVDDVAVDGDNITFSWLLSRRVTQYEGDVNFIVCAVRVSGETITNEWNTTLATAQVLEGLEAEVVLPEDETDIVNQLLALAETRLNDVRDATSAANTAASNANQKAQEAKNAAEDARAVTEQITKDSYLHTALQSFIDTVTARPTAYGNAIVKKIEGFIRQETTTGAQLFDIDSTVTENQATKAILNDGRDLQVTGKKVDSSFGYAYYTFPAEKVSGKTLYVYVEYDSGLGCEFHIKDAANKWTYPMVSSGTWTTISVPSNVRQCSMLFYPNRTTETEVTGVYKNIKVGFTQFETWEPYTGGQPAPNPDYPMEVQGTGFRGSNGLDYDYVYHNTGNSLSFNDEWISCVNKIPCKAGDNVEIIYNKANKNSMYGIIYYKGDEFVSLIGTQTGNGKFTVPSNVDGFQWQVYESGDRPDPSQVIVKINGKYAVCVKAESPNIFNMNGRTAGSAASADMYGDTVKITTLTGSGKSPGVFFYLGPISKFLGKRLYIKADKMESSHSAEGKASCRMVLRTIKNGSSVQSFGIYQNTKAGTWMQSAEIPDDLDIYSVTHLCLQLYVGDGTTQVAVGETATFENVMVCVEKTDKYHPYQSNITYIPVDYPLFAGDKIIQRNGEYKLVRKWGHVVFDGSDDEDWNKSASNDYTYYILNMKEAFTDCEVYSNWMKKGSLSDRPGIYIRNDLNIYLNNLYNPANTLDEFIQRLKTHTMYCIYELATPTEEPLSPEAVKALNSIMATDEQTELTIVGIPEDAGIQNQFLLPRNEDGALNTTAYCTSVKNKLTLDELLSQSLDSRVNKLEIDNAALAEQTIVVE